MDTDNITFTVIMTIIAIGICISLIRLRNTIRRVHKKRDIRSLTQTTSQPVDNHQYRQNYTPPPARKPGGIFAKIFRRIYWLLSSLNTRHGQQSRPPPRQCSHCRGFYFLKTKYLSIFFFKFIHLYIILPFFRKGKIRYVRSINIRCVRSINIAKRNIVRIYRF